MGRKTKRKGAGKPSSAAGGRASAPSGEASGGGRSINTLGVVVSVALLALLVGTLLVLGPGEPPPPKTSASDVLPDAPIQSSADAAAEALVKWSAEPVENIPVSSERDFIRGAPEAAVRIVEFSDFQCPFCRTANVNLERVLDRYRDDVQLVFKNLPLDDSCNGAMTQPLHVDACRAAVMARCAGASAPENFWRFHDRAFASDSLREEILLEIADSLGLRDPAFDRCVASGDALREVQVDVQLALRLKLASTPTFFINGRKAPSYEADILSAIIDHIVATD